MYLNFSLLFTMRRLNPSRAGFPHLSHGLEPRGGGLLRRGLSSVRLPQSPPLPITVHSLHFMSHRHLTLRLSALEKGDPGSTIRITTNSDTLLGIRTPCGVLFFLRLLSLGRRPSGRCFLFEGQLCARLKIINE